MTIHLPSERWTVDLDSNLFFLSTMQAALSYADGLIHDRPLIKVIDIDQRLIRLTQVANAQFELPEDEKLEES